MDRQNLKELHYIAPIANLSSIMDVGLLSNEKAQRVKHVSVAMEAVQDKRDVRTIPGGRRLHEYVNLYFNARNPMMYFLKSRHNELAVVRVSTDVLDLPQVVIADGNASSDWTSFRPPEDGLARINRESVFAEYWTDPNPIAYYRKKSAVCAEVLVPDKVSSELILGVYISNESVGSKVRTMLPIIDLLINPWLFFQGARPSGAA